jgi:hypothetical protein
MPGLSRGPRQGLASSRVFSAGTVARARLEGTLARIAGINGGGKQAPRYAEAKRRIAVRRGMSVNTSQPRRRQIGGYACGYQAIFVPSIALASPGYDGQPAVYLYIAALEVNVLNCRWERDQMSRICARACPSGGRAGPCAVRLGSARC